MKRFRWTPLLAAALITGCSLGTPPGRGTPKTPASQATASWIETLERQSTDSPSPLWNTGIPRPEGSDPVAVEKSEAEDASRLSLSEQETILAADNWVRNVELSRWVENGMKDPNPKQDIAKLKRLAEINGLNMSEAERKKKKPNVFEYSPGLLSHWRWYHKGIERLAAIPTEQRHSPETFLPEPDSFLRDKTKQMLQANAAILSGRDGDPSAKPYLIAIVRESGLKVEFRCAAAETLGRLPDVTADDLLPLLELARGSDDPADSLRRPMIQALWTEILTGLAEKIELQSHPCFLEPLESRNAAMRAAALKLWRQGAPDDAIPEDERPQLPEAFLEYAKGETEASLRLEIVKTFGAWKEPHILELVRKDMTKSAILANAAMDALAEAECMEAVPLIKERLRNPVGKNRAKAVESLRKLGCLDDVFRLKDDKEREVRVEVARALADRCTPQTVELAGTYLKDGLAVQEAVVEAVANWPVEHSGPILLEALKSRQPDVRLRAGAKLSEYLDDAKQYDVLDLPNNQTERHAELVRSFERSLGDLKKIAKDSRPVVRDRRSANGFDPTDPAVLEVRRCLDDWNRPGLSYDDRRALVERLVLLGDRLVPVFEHLYATERRKIPVSLDKAVLAEVDPAFAAIVRLDSENETERRKAAEELLRQSRGRELGKLAASRILDRAQRQEQPATKNTLLEVLAAADAAAARVFARTLLESETAETRRRACEVLGRFGTVRDLEALAEMLGDPSRDVVRRSIESIAAIGGEIEPAAGDFDLVMPALESLLLRQDLFLQADAAATLHMIGNAKGTDALRRLSLSDDRRVRYYVAQTIAATEDPAFVPVLIRLLDSGGNAAQAALDNLPKLVGRDVGALENRDNPGDEELTASQRRIVRWKRWAQNSGRNDE